MIEENNNVVCTEGDQQALIGANAALLKDFLSFDVYAECKQISFIGHFNTI